MTMRTQLVDQTGNFLMREYGDEVAQEYEERFLAEDLGSPFGEPQIEDMPNNVNFNAGVEYINQVVSYDRITFWGYLMDMIKSGT
jgi:hypothetical protein